VKKLLGALLLFLGATHAPCQVRAAIDRGYLAREQAATGSKPKYFGVVDDGVYKGAKPRSDADYRFLQ
jgi:hypothetical protein